MLFRKDVARPHNRLIPPVLASHWPVLIIAIVGFLFSLGIHLSHLRYWNSHKTFYYDGSTPLMTTLDAYYYLQITSEILAKTSPAKTSSISVEMADLAKFPLLASLTASIHKIFNIPIEQIAFYLPPILGSFMVAIYVCWGGLLAGPLMVLLASLAGLSSFYWYSRTCLGRFDTDCMNPFFVYMILFLVYRFVVGKGHFRFIYLSASILMAFLFGIWWGQVQWLGFLLIVVPYCLSFYLPSSKLERILKISGLLTIIAILIFILVDLQHLLPSYSKNTVVKYLQHLTLITKKTSSNSAFPNVGQSISELQPLSINDIATEVGGHYIPFAASLIGLCLLFKTRKDTACFLLTGFALASLSLISRRFLIFLVPLYALGLSYFLAKLYSVISQQRRFESTPLKAGILIVFLIASSGLLLPSIYRSLSEHRGPPLSNNDVLLARSILNETSGKEVIWSWWDYGYFLEYITGKRAFIDGGSQSPERTFITAFPLACDNPVLARNWMRFFAAHDMSGWEDLIAKLGSPAKAFDFLKEVLANPGKMPEILIANGLEDSTTWSTYLFPDARASLYLNTNLLGKTYWWYYFGTWDPIHGEGIHPDFWSVNLIDAKSLMRDGGITLGGKKKRVVELIDVGKSGAMTSKTATLQSSNDQGNQIDNIVNATNNVNSYAAVSLQASKISYIFNLSMLHTLTLRLLLLSPFLIPEFETLAYYPRIGGVWNVR